MVALHGGDRLRRAYARDHWHLAVDENLADQQIAILRRLLQRRRQAGVAGEDDAAAAVRQGQAEGRLDRLVVDEEGVDGEVAEAGDLAFPQLLEDNLQPARVGPLLEGDAQ